MEHFFISVYKKYCIAILLCVFVFFFHQCLMKFDKKSDKGNLSKPEFILEDMVEAVQKKEVKCPICFLKFGSNKIGNLNRHLKLHSKDQRRYCCLICERTYQTLSNFEVHKSSRHGDLEKSEISFEIKWEKAKGINSEVMHILL